MTAVRAASPHAREALVDVAAVAAYLNVDRSWVYAHADELGARRLGSGPKARLRFSLEDVDAAVTCSGNRGSDESLSGSRRRRRPSAGTSVPLLPIRGRTEGS